MIGNQTSRQSHRDCTDTKPPDEFKAFLSTSVHEHFQQHKIAPKNRKTDIEAAKCERDLCQG